MLRLTAHTFGGQCREYTYVMLGAFDTATWVYCWYGGSHVKWSDRNLGQRFPIVLESLAEIVNFSHLSTSLFREALFSPSISLPVFWMIPAESAKMLRFRFFLTVDMGWRVISFPPNRRGSYSLSGSLCFLTRGRTLGIIQGPLKSVWVISCQRRWEQQQIGLLKQFSLTGELLSGCQQSDYSIQLFGCSQSALTAPRTEPHGYLSIPDTQALVLLLHKEGEGHVSLSTHLSHFNLSRLIEMVAFFFFSQIGSSISTCIFCPAC